MKGISNIVVILGLCVIMTVKAVPVGLNTDKEKNITDVNTSINAKVCLCLIWLCIQVHPQILPKLISVLQR